MGPFSLDYSHRENALAAWMHAGGAVVRLGCAVMHDWSVAAILLDGMREGNCGHGKHGSGEQQSERI